MDAVCVVRCAFALLGLGVENEEVRLRGPLGVGSGNGGGRDIRIERGR